MCLPLLERNANYLAERVDYRFLGDFGVLVLRFPFLHTLIISSTS